MVLHWEMSQNDYQHHRSRVMNARSSLNTFGGKYLKSTFYKPQKIKDDTDRSCRVTIDTFHLFRKINAGMRLPKLQNQIWTSKSTMTNTQVNASRIQSKHRQLDRHLNTLDRENKVIGHRIISVKSQNLSSTPESFIGKLEKKCAQSFHVPSEILTKYENFNVKIPRDRNTLRRLLRPKVFLDLALHGIRRFHYVIELFTEACPQVVLEFVRACKSRNSALFKVIRVFPNLWLEAEMKLKENSNSNKLSTSNIEYDMRAVDHRSAGILSFAKSNLKGFQFGVINFSISFKPLSVNNGTRVGFGRLLAGKRDHNIVQEFGTKNGVITKPVKILDCGVLA